MLPTGQTGDGSPADGSCLPQFFQLVIAAGKVGWWWRKLVKGDNNRSRCFRNVFAPHNVAVDLGRTSTEAYTAGLYAASGGNGVTDVCVLNGDRCPRLLSVLFFVATATNGRRKRRQQRLTLRSSTTSLSARSIG
jgi:hypothetical protein